MIGSRRLSTELGDLVETVRTGGHRDYHPVTSFLADLADRVASLDHRIVVDKPKPDPEAPCHQ
ncbi:MAG: hypothetical protein ACJ8DC_09310 [Gemmatimonadales bacterium]